MTLLTLLSPQVGVINGAGKYGIEQQYGADQRFYGGGTTSSVTSATGTFALTGQAATLTITAAKKVVADTGTFTLTGQAATLRAGRPVVAAPGSFTLNGQVAILRAGRPVFANTGVFALTGQPATLKSSRLLAAATGAFALTGNAATVSFGPRVTAVRGLFALTGNAAALKAGLRVTASRGTFTLTGNDAALKSALRMASSHGAFTLSGLAVPLRLGRSLIANHRDFFLAGQAITFGKGIAFMAQRLEFALTGNNATLRLASKVSAQTGAFTLTGNAASIRALQALRADTGTFTLNGQSTSFGAGFAFEVNRGIFALTGRAAALGFGRKLTASKGTFALTGQAATLLKGKRLTASKGTFALTGPAISFTLYTSLVGKHQVDPFPSPVNQGTPIDANIVRANDNIVAAAFSAHDASAPLHVQSGTLAVRPAVLPDGSMYIGTDTALIYFYTGGQWVTIGELGQTGRRWGAFQDFTTQSHSTTNTAKLVTFDTTDVSYGVAVDAGLTNSKIGVTQAGVYNFQWSGQFKNTDTQIHDVDIWIAKNGTYVTGSNGTVSVPNSHGGTPGNVLPGWNYYLTLSAGDYIQLYWAVSNTAVTLAFQAANAVHPSTASIICTMSKV